MNLSRYMISALVALGTVNFSACVAPDVQDAGKAATAAAQAVAGVSAVVDKATAETAVKEAEAENKAAGKVSFEWRDNAQMLEKANEALKKGEFQTAQKLANKVKRMAKAAQQQALDQKNAGPRF